MRGLALMDPLSMKSRVISAFPATGKTYVAANDHRFVDSDSSRFSWGTPGVRNPNWPDNYLLHITSALNRGDSILVSTHAEVRAALERGGLGFTLVYPDSGLRDEYQARMEYRGSPDRLIRKIIDNWHTMLMGCVAQEGCEHVVLHSGQYLSDVLPGIARAA